MPQMSPLSWLSIFFMLILLMILMFSNFKNESFKITNKKHMKEKNITMKW